MVDEPTTEELVRRAKAGDREAAGGIARRFGDFLRAKVHGRLAGRVHARVDTEDVLQSTFLVTLGDLADFEWRGEEAFVGWLVQVAERQVLQEARRHRALRRDVRRECALDAASDRPAGRTSPTQAAVRRELTMGIRGAVETLPGDERRAVELHTCRGLSFDAVAREMGLADRAAAYRLFEKALKTMAKSLDAGEGAGS
ncbi:MAG: sigma-70 family RNA polymerase sigma factor [Planctomycetes bacterium]|jgi:RNA polymerase sigma-70 factor (ECF subfamily)|nr:sigma-70 family RNA polymerase sigma factor [Planctomycetota bacterium]